MRLEVKGLSFAYSQKYVLNDVSFALNSGDFLVVIGKNGSGKSTLIKCILGLLKVADNTIFLDDVDINQRLNIQQLGYVPQKTDFNYEFPITVKEVLTSSYRQKKRDSHYTSIINLMDLNRFYYENINNLSGGQLQRIFIARALLNNPKLLILDEPTVGVDVSNLVSLKETLKKLKEKRITIILVTHDVKFVNDLADYCLELDEVLEYSFTKVGENLC